MSVTTKRIVDKRIEPQPDPVYAATISPVQNQFYTLPASGLSNSYITFNNLTTLGVDRAFLDTFELEITAEITLHGKADGDCFTEDPTEAYTAGSFNRGARYKWTFDSFPFNKCCDEVRVNINGGAMFSSPLAYLRAKERYWDEKKISDAYTGICPCHKPCMQNETGMSYNAILANSAANAYRVMASSIKNKLPVRTMVDSGYNPTASGINSSTNNSHVPYYLEPAANGDRVVTVTWREPIFASPFSSKIDANYGRPLYNITSIDIAINLMDLRNMIVCRDPNITYSVNITQCQLCYQIETVPAGIAPPLTVVPYRRFVPYVIEHPNAMTNGGTVNIKSGAYTFNEVPTAIWIFLGPTKAELQQYSADTYQNGTYGAVTLASSYNRSFGFVKNINISLANTTQILSTAKPQDLYRICKANGLQDSYQSWGMAENSTPIAPIEFTRSNNTDKAVFVPSAQTLCPGMGSVIRLIPGTDIILPDQPLIPGTNANNMVFNLDAVFDVPSLPAEFNRVALWILFEYVGVAKITPGQCEISMNPLGNGAIMNSAPIESASANEEPSTVEGSGWLDTIKQIGGLLKNTGIVGNLVSAIPGIGPVAGTVAKALGWGKIANKRPRITGGATMGLGDFC